MKQKLLLVLAAGVLLAAQASKDEIKKEIDRMQGTWTVSSLTIGGKEIPAETLKDLSAEIKGDKYIIKMGDKVIEDGTFTVDPSKKPKSIDSIASSGPNKGKKSVGVYELDGDTMKMCSAPSGSDKRPTEFASKAGSENELAVYKRSKK